VDEFSAVLKAREFVRDLSRRDIPVDINAYLARSDCHLRADDDLSPDEAGYCVTLGGKRYIVVNGSDPPERQRFTACHEIGHIVLNLPSQHSGVPLWSYAKRPPNEVFCDVFAAELLLPYEIFKPLADRAIIGFGVLDDLARKFLASVMATGSRFAAAVDTPCAFVISQDRVVRYASRSKPLREVGAWISPGRALPVESASRNAAGVEVESGEIAADEWFHNWRRGGTLIEEARYLARWNQTLTLLWFEDGEMPKSYNREERISESEEALDELDGTLRWPGKRKRR